MKQTIIVDSKELLDWFFRDDSWLDNMDDIEDRIKSDLKKKGESKITLRDIYQMAGWIPCNAIVNPDVIPKERKVNVYDDNYDNFDIDPEPTDRVQFLVIKKKKKRSKKCQK